MKICCYFTGNAVYFPYVMQLPREGDDSMRFMAHLSRRIKELRDQRHMTQYALAKAAGVPQVTIWRIERGKQQGIDARLVRRLAIALNVSMDDLGGRFEETIIDPKPALSASA